MNTLKITVLSIVIAIGIVYGLRYGQSGPRITSVQIGDKLCTFDADGTRRGCWGPSFYPNQGANQGL